MSYYDVFVRRETVQAQRTKHSEIATVPKLVHTRLIRISSYLPPDIGERLARIAYLNPYDFLFCVGYANYHDFQLGLSGTCNRHEPEKQTLEREVLEEIGMGLGFREELGTTRYHPVSQKTQDYTFYEADPRDLKPCGFPFLPGAEHPDKSRKIVLLIHGHKKYMEALLEQVVSLPGCPDDDIDRYAIVSVRDALDHAIHIPSTY
jgi:8-oxo-dGTP pyrophosphatase MutT (NUDIX family)